MLEHLLEAAPDRYEVTIFNAEPRVNYDRIMLSPVLTGEKDFEQIIIHGDGWYIKNGITLYKGHKITAIDRVAKTVTSDRGVVQPYDKLVIATGSVPLNLPVPGNNLAGVLTFRDLDDVNAMMLAAQSRSKAVVASLATNSPSRRMVMRSAICRASSMACEMKTIDTPRSFSRSTKAKK